MELLHLLTTVCYLTELIPFTHTSDYEELGDPEDGSSGVQTSKNYPAAYPTNSDCTHRIFSIDLKKRVRVQFLEFDLFKHNEITVCDEEQDDHIAIYDPDQDGELHQIGVFCGQRLPMAVMSSGNELVVEFRSFHRPVRGVYSRNLYAFHWQSDVSDFGIGTGRQRIPYECYLDYHSKAAISGTFSSPNYPGLYPKATECHYAFHGSSKESLQLNIVYFDMEGIEECEEYTESDYLEVKKQDRETHRIISLTRYCGLTRPGQLDALPTESIVVRFFSNRIWDGSGFHAHYKFIPVPTTTVETISTTGLSGIEPGSGHEDFSGLSGYGFEDSGVGQSVDEGSGEAETSGNDVAISPESTESASGNGEQEVEPKGHLGPKAPLIEN